MAKGIFGERLKRERELREVTLEEITIATRIGPRFLEALENEQWDKLPGGVFNRGFVRSIARYLGLDEEALLAEYDLARGTEVDGSQNHPESRIPSPPKWIPIAILLGLFLVLAGVVLGGIYFWRHRGARHTANASLLREGQSPFIACWISPWATVAGVERCDFSAAPVVRTFGKIISAGTK